MGFMEDSVTKHSLSTNFLTHFLTMELEWHFESDNISSGLSKSTKLYQKQSVQGMDPFFFLALAFKFGHHAFARATFQNWTTVNATFPRTWMNFKQVMDTYLMTVKFIYLFMLLVFARWYLQKIKR